MAKSLRLSTRYTDNGFMFSQSFLIASLVWGSIGAGCIIYGKKRAETVPLVGGAMLIGISFLIASWLVMSLVGVAIIVSMRFLTRLGY